MAAGEEIESLLKRVAQLEKALKYIRGYIGTLTPDTDIEPEDKDRLMATADKALGDRLEVE
jgi:hypothetical protein